ncbi:Transcriptional regulator, AraC family protein [Minicystis rosea]|nr:Transcriptional regulator, AraC family protein [Minicystis rosea]
MRDLRGVLPDLPMHDLIPHLERAAPADGMTATAVPFMRVNRRSHAGTAHAHVLSPCVGIFLAGHKRVRLGRRDVCFRQGDTFAIARATPVISHVVAAPYLCVMLSVDAEIVAELDAYPPAASSDVAEPLARLVRLLDSPSEIPVLAPLFQRELFYRLLAGPSGDALRELSRGHDPLVAAAIAWLDAHYAEPFSAERLAAHVHASVSVLYARFKERMRITPLQYQKERRLHAARRLLLTGDVDASTAAYRVGYASAAQFNREYRRAFGAPPRRDVEALRRSTSR